MDCYADTDSVRRNGVLWRYALHDIASFYELYDKRIKEKLNAKYGRNNMELNIEENKRKFEELVRTNVKRDGVEELLTYLRERTDFYEAPCSTKYHLNVKGGLCYHSLSVYQAMQNLINEFGGWWRNEDAPAVVSLFHDLCKVNFYVVEKRWRKVDGVWEQYDTWGIDDSFVYGHGEKSVLLLSDYIQLNPEEEQAIRFHMGAWMVSEARNAGKVFEQNNLAAMLHLADMASTYLLEK